MEKSIQEHPGLDYWGVMGLLEELLASWVHRPRGSSRAPRRVQASAPESGSIAGSLKRTRIYVVEDGGRSQQEPTARISDSQAACITSIVPKPMFLLMLTGAGTAC